MGENMYKKFVSSIIITIIISSNVVFAAKTWNEYKVSEYENASDMYTAETLYNALMRK